MSSLIFVTGRRGSASLSLGSKGKIRKAHSKKTQRLPVESAARSVVGLEFSKILLVRGPYHAYYFHSAGSLWGRQGQEKDPDQAARQIVLQDNVSLKNMDTSSLLDILHRPSQSQGGGAQAAAKASGSGMKALLEGVEELWDNTEYAEEFSVDNFVQGLT